MSHSARPTLVVLLVLMVVAACGGGARPRAVADLRGFAASPPPLKPSFTLIDTNGQRYDLGRQTRGKLTYLYFGYTHCDDTCPTTMADLATALRGLSTADRAAVSVVFVTTDPQRDSPPVLRRWLDRFSPQFVGLTGTEPQIQNAEAQAGEPLSQADAKGGTYSVFHSSQLFAYSPDGVAHALYLANSAPSDYAHDIPQLLRLR